MTKTTKDFQPQRTAPRFFLAFLAIFSSPFFLLVHVDFEP